MASESSSRKSISKGKCVMHNQQNYFDTHAYNEFIQCQSYVDDTQNNHPLIISKPTSANPLESQSQNQPSHFEIFDDEGDDQETIDTHERRKKFDLFEVHKIGWNHSNGLQSSRSSSGRNSEVTTHIDNISPILIPLKLRSQRQKVKRKFLGTLLLPINYFVILMLIIGKN